MKSLRDVMGRELIWHRVRLAPARYELRVGDETLVVLDQPRLFGREVHVSANGGEWRIRRPRLFSRGLSIRNVAADSEAAEYRGGLRGGTLRTADGREYRITPAGILPRTLALSLATGSGVITVSWRFPPLGRVARTSIEPAGAAEPQLGLLAAIAFYVLLVRRRRAARSSAGG